MGEWVRQRSPGCHPPPPHGNGKPWPAPEVGKNRLRIPCPTRCARPIRPRPAWRPPVARPCPVLCSMALGQVITAQNRTTGRLDYRGTVVPQVKGMLHMCREGETLVSVAFYQEMQRASARDVRGADVTYTDRGEHILIDGVGQLVRTLYTSRNDARRALYTAGATAAPVAVVSVYESSWTPLKGAATNSAARKSPPASPVTPGGGAGDFASGEAAQFMQEVLKLLELTPSGEPSTDFREVLRVIKWLQTERLHLQMALRDAGLKEADLADIVEQVQAACSGETSTPIRPYRVKKVWTVLGPVGAASPCPSLTAFRGHTMSRENGLCLGDSCTS